MTGERKRGRKPKLTRDLIERVADLLDRGCYIETACAKVGIHPSTFFRWMNEAAAADAPPLFREFREAVEAASVNAEVRAVEAWQRFFDKDWRSAATFLERRFGDRWGARGATGAQEREAEARAATLGEARREFPSYEAELTWWAEERGLYPRPAKFLVFDASAWKNEAEPTSSELPRDSRGRRLWPLLVTLDALSPEEREVYEQTGLTPWEVETGALDDAPALPPETHVLPVAVTTPRAPARPAPSSGRSRRRESSP